MTLIYNNLKNKKTVIFIYMEKKLLTEINNMRRIMGLELLMEGPRDEIYQLLKRFTSKETTQIEKNEIESLLKKAGVTDNELKLLKQGQEAILTSLSGRLVGKITGELAQEFEEKILQKGIPIKALSNLDGGPRLISKIEELHTKYLKGELSLTQYEVKIKKIKDGLSKTMNTQELERAITSIEKNNEVRFKAPSAADELIKDLETAESKITTEPTQQEIEQTFEELVGSENYNELKKKFSDASDEQLKIWKDLYETGRGRDSINKKFDEIFDKNPSLWETISKMPLWKKMLWGGVTLFGGSFLLSYWANGGSFKFANPTLWGRKAAGAETEEEKENKQKLEGAKIILNFANYGMYVGDNTEMISTLEEFIAVSGTVTNNLEKVTKETAKNFWEKNYKEYVSPRTWVTAMNEIAKLIQLDLDNVTEIKADKWKVKVRPETEFEKQIISRAQDWFTKTREKFDKDFREKIDKIKNPEKKVDDAGSGSNNKRQGGKPFYTNPDIPSDL